MAPESRRLLMFAPLCYPPTGSEAIVAAKLVLAFLNVGWQVDVITQSDFGQYYPLQPGPTWNALARVCHCIPDPEDGGAKSGLRAYAAWSSRLRPLFWATNALIRARQLAAAAHYDFILSRATPQYGHLPALLMAKMTKLPWIANWSDPLPPVKAPPPYGLGLDASLAPHQRVYVASVANGANWHTFPCERLRQYYCRYLPAIAAKSSVIPHPALERFRAKSFERSPKFELCCIGSLAMRDPRVFLEGVKLFRGRSDVGAALCVRFVGPSLELPEESVRGLGLQQEVIIEDVKSYEATLAVASSAAVLVSIEAACEEGIFFPSKVTDFVQTGRPILAVSPRNGTMADLLDAHGGGVAADCRLRESVAAAIQLLYTEWKNGTLLQNYGSSKLFSIFGEDRIVAAYANLFEKLGARAGD